MTISKPMLGAMVVGLSLALPRFVTASEEGHHEGGHVSEEGLAPPGELRDIWEAVEQRSKALDDAVEGGELEGVHEVAFQIRDLVKALADHSDNLDEAKQKSLRGSLARVGQVADLLDKYGDAGDRVNTQAQAKRMKSLLNYIEHLYPEGMLGSGEHEEHAEMEMHKESGSK